MKKILRPTSIGDLLTLLLLAVLALCVLSVLLTGADTFSSVTDRDRLSYDRRTAAQYITTRLHQADAAGMVTLEPFGDTVALTCAEDLDGETYLTRVYFHNGALMELFSAADAALSPEDGESVMPISALTLREENGMILAEVTDSSGMTVTIRLALRGGREAA